MQNREGLPQAVDGDPGAQLAADPSTTVPVTHCQHFQRLGLGLMGEIEQYRVQPNSRTALKTLLAGLE